jgi:hypothetical protein
MAVAEQAPVRSSLKINFFDRTRDPVWFELWKLYGYCALWAVAVIAGLFPFVVGPALGLMGPGASPSLSTVLTRVGIIAACGVFDYYAILMPFEWYFHRYLFHRQEEFFGRVNKLRNAHVAHHTDHDDEHYDTRTVEQTYKAHFPGKALPGFGVLFSVPILVLGLIGHALLHEPLWLAYCGAIGMGFGVLFGYGRYEGRYHAQDHRPLQEWWIPRMEDPEKGAYWRAAYAEHRGHHRYPGYNEAVFARDGNSWPSRVFRTYLECDIVTTTDEGGRTRVVLENGQPKMTYGAFPQPLPWVTRLDAKYGPAFPKTAP